MQRLFDFTLNRVSNDLGSDLGMENTQDENKK